MAAGYPVHDEPPDIQHAGVVVNVEKRDLVIVLPEYEEEGVHKLDELREVVPPQHVHDLGGHREKIKPWDNRKNSANILPKSTMTQADEEIIVLKLLFRINKK